MVDFGKPLSLRLNHSCFKDLVRLFKSFVGNDVKTSFQDKVSLQAKASSCSFLRFFLALGFKSTRGSFSSSLEISAKSWSLSGYFSPQKAFHVDKAVFVANCVFF